MAVSYLHSIYFTPDFYSFSSFSFYLGFSFSFQIQNLPINSIFSFNNLFFRLPLSTSSRFPFFNALSHSCGRFVTQRSLTLPCMHLSKLVREEEGEEKRRRWRNREEERESHLIKLFENEVSKMLKILNFKKWDKYRFGFDNLVF